eukprot:SAG11_NODE_13452_length_654_cov_2.839640_1_plen_71_part_01
MIQLYRGKITLDLQSYLFYPTAVEQRTAMVKGKSSQWSNPDNDQATITIRMLRRENCALKRENCALKQENR